jgi:hypothetical protein
LGTTHGCLLRGIFELGRNRGIWLDRTKRQMSRTLLRISTIAARRSCNARRLSADAEA